MMDTWDLTVLFLQLLVNLQLFQKKKKLKVLQGQYYYYPHFTLEETRLGEVK